MSDVVVVMLRQPKSNAGEKRSDPFWEFGSFGCTGCHRHNVMHPKRIEELEGRRIAFAQGGKGEVRLVFLTPPVSVRRHANGCELTWRLREMPFKFTEAPILVSNKKKPDVSAILEAIEGVDRKTPVAQFASRFRSRRQPVDDAIGREIEKIYKRFRRRKNVVAKCYAEALPFDPPLVDTRRRQTYKKLVDAMKSEAGVD